MKICSSEFSPHSLVFLIVRLLYHAIDATGRRNKQQWVLFQWNVAWWRRAIDILPGFRDAVGQLIRGDSYNRAILKVKFKRRCIIGDL
jgi:hypothetical protein